MSKFKKIPLVLSHPGKTLCSRILNTTHMAPNSHNTMPNHCLGFRFQVFHIPWFLDYIIVSYIMVSELWGNGTPREMGFVRYGDNFFKFAMVSPICGTQKWWHYVSLTKQHVIHRQDSKTISAIYIYIHCKHIYICTGIYIYTHYKYCIYTEYIYTIY